MSLKSIIEKIIKNINEDSIVKSCKNCGKVTTHIVRDDGSVVCTACNQSEETVTAKENKK